MHTTINMDKKTFEQLHDKIEKALNASQLGKAIRSMKEMCLYVGNSTIKDSLERISANYDMMLAYMSRGIVDEQRDKLYMQFIQDVDKLFSSISREVCLRQSESHYAVCWKTLKNMSMEDNLFQISRSGVSLRNLFDIVWTSPIWREDDYEFVRNLLSDAEYDATRKCLIVSSVMLSTLTFFDELKLRVLIKSLDNVEQNVRMRAFVGMILVLAQYPDKSKLYPSIERELHPFMKQERFAKEIVQLQMQILLCLDTPKFEHKVKEDIMPSIIETSKKLRTDMKNINLEDFNSQVDSYTEKADWETSNHDVDEKVKSLLDLQRKGADVFIGQFKMVKQNFPFFNVAANWFMPFTQEHPDLPKNIYHTPIISLIEKNYNLCESDKYSFSLIIGQMLSANMGADAIKEMNEQMGEILDNSFPKNKQSAENIQQIMRSYMLDLYRYFTLFRLRDEMIAPFKTNLFVAQWELFKPLFSHNNDLQVLADFCFELENYDLASKLYEMKQCTAKDYQKIGFCYHKKHQFSKAKMFYEKADTAMPNQPWTLMQLGNCSRSLGDYNNALVYYGQIVKIQPENVSALLRMGECMIYNEDYSNALQKLFKAYYFCPDNSAVIRSIAWCYFKNKQREEAEKFYVKLFSKQPTPIDFLNAGHVAWVSDNMSLAIERYLQYVQQQKIPKELIDNIFEEDRECLQSYGINANDISLMCDILYTKF